MLPILTVSVRYEHDVVAARQRARQIAALLSFDGQEQTRIATAVSELTRNALVYGGGGKVEFALETSSAPQVFVITVTDQGKGIDNLSEILSGTYKSQTGMGLGIIGARRLMDGFHIETAAGKGVTICLRKILPSRAPLITRDNLPAIVDSLSGASAPRTLLEELQQQNRELIQTLDELNTRQEELRQLNTELADTNRGVIALYAELDEKADHLRRADQLKSRFLSNMSHEFRTPLNSILALTRILFDRIDGDLTPEQEKQVGFIRKAAEDLYELVNDLLDLAKVEAGKIEIRPVEFEIADLFGALRGMLRPLLVNQRVNLVFEDADDLPPLRTDEGKISQILRNLISNALKFTQAGEIRISARLVRSGETVVVPHSALGEDTEATTAREDCILFAVQDTGIGIAPDNQRRIFSEFVQIDNPIQRKVRGTGLGLSLSKKLAELLGGSIRLRSEEGLGSTFAAIIPCSLALAREETPAPLESGNWPVLIIEDSAEDRMIYERLLGQRPFQPAFATNIVQARDMARRLRPAAIFLDIMIQGEAAWSLLTDLKRDPATRHIPIIVATTLDDERTATGLGADAFFSKPLESARIRETLELLIADGPAARILIIEDDEAQRYILHSQLAAARRTILEAPDGIRGLQMASTHQPSIIILDLNLPGIPGERLLRLLKADETTASIPVIILTANTLSDHQRTELAQHAVTILNKGKVSRWELLSTIAEALASLHDRPPSLAPAPTSPLTATETR